MSRMGSALSVTLRIGCAKHASNSSRERRRLACISRTYQHRRKFVNGGAFVVDRLLDHLGPRTIVLAHKAEEAYPNRELIQEQGAPPNIPSKSNRRWKPCFSKRLYRERNLIERFLF